MIFWQVCSQFWIKSVSTETYWMTKIMGVMLTVCCWHFYFYFFKLEKLQFQAKIWGSLLFISFLIGSFVALSFENRPLWLLFTFFQRPCILYETPKASVASVVFPFQL